MEQEKVIEVLKEKFEEEILQVEKHYDFLTISLKKDKIVEIIQYLYHHVETKFQYLTTLSGIHYPDQNQIAVMYQLHNLVSNERLRLKTYLPADNPVTKTLTPVFMSANWMERETYDFFGVIFEGHSDLRRIMLPEDWVGYPLRKDYVEQEEYDGISTQRAPLVEKLLR